VITARDIISQRIDRALIGESDDEEPVPPALSREATLSVKISVSRSSGTPPPVPAKPSATPLKGSLFEGVLEQMKDIFVF
jgi:hypothetical protein